MGKTQSKQPLSQEELFRIYRQHKVTSIAKACKKNRFLPLNLTKDESLPCFGCMLAKNVNIFHNIK